MFDFFGKNKSVVNKTLFAIVLLTVLILGTSVLVPIEHVNAQAAGPVPGQPQFNPYTGTPVGPVDPNVSCGWFDFDCLWNKLVLNISVIILTIGSWILWVAGQLIEAVLQYTIVGMSAAVKNGGLGIAITESWRAFRDLANIAFIFILLYISIGTILGLGNVDMKKMLARVIIVALLLNFSLFFTKIMIDASNATTVVFYNAILKDQPKNSANNSGGISGAFMSKFGLTSLWSSETSKQVLSGGMTGNTTNNSNFKILMLGLFGFIFMLVAAFVFFAMAILFIQRFIALMFILVLSPAAFAVMALPNEKYSSKWWSALWDQLIFAPACMAMLWVTLKLLKGVTSSINIADSDGIGQLIAGAENGAAIPGAGAVIMNFVIVIAFMIGTLLVAKATGASGASGMLKFGKKLRVGAQGYFGSATAGTLGYAGRRTIGWTGRNIADSEALKKAESRGGALGALAGAVRDRSKKIAKSSFDVRATAIGGELAGTIGGIGKAGGKGGYDKFVEEREKLALERAKDLGPSRVLVDQSQQAIEKTKEKEAAIKESYRTPLELLAAEEKVIKDRLGPSEKKLEDMKKEQLADMEKLKDASLSDIAKTQIQKRISDRADGINTLSNKLQIDLIPLGKIKDRRTKIEEKMQEEIKVVIEERKSAQEKLESLKGMSAEEAVKRVRADAEKMFNRDEAKIKAFMEGEGKKRIEELKRNAGDKRALDYAKNAVEKPWRSAFRIYKNRKTLEENRPMFSGTRYNEAQKIRSEFSKSKEDKQMDKLIDAIKKGKPEEAENPIKKPDENKE